MGLKELIKEIEAVNASMRKYTVSYFNSREFFSIRDNDSQSIITYDINDMMLLGALTNSDILLAGGTGAGKSHFSRMVMNGLYGRDGFTNLTVTPGLNESDFIDIDIKAIKEGKKTIKEAIGTTPLLTRPGAIINEINRTPEILQNLFISYLERIFSLKGSEFPVGVAFDKEKDEPQDPHYQFRVLSINEGVDYSGTSGIDRAVRDRVVIEIPMDYFTPSKSDLEQMIQTRNNSDLTIDRANGGELKQVLEVSSGVTEIPYSVSSEDFLVYLSGLNNCIKSLSHSKKGVNFRNQECAGCHHVKDSVSDKSNLCGSVYAPSERSLINLKKVGRIVAALRAYKVIDAVCRGELGIDDPQKFVENYLKNLEVTMSDLSEVAPFVLTSKMIIDPKWINENFQGSKYLATKHVIEMATEKYKNYVASKVYSALLKGKGVVDSKIRSQLEQYAREVDPWAYRLGETTGVNGKNERIIDITELL